MKVASIMQNFGISKTQDSKKPSTKESQQQQSYTVEYNILDQLRNTSNENVSSLVGKSD